jgi:hypothetical protein
MATTKPKACIVCGAPLSDPEPRVWRGGYVCEEHYGVSDAPGTQEAARNPDGASRHTAARTVAGLLWLSGAIGLAGSLVLAFQSLDQGFQFSAPLIVSAMLGSLLVFAAAAGLGILIEVEAHQRAIRQHVVRRPAGLTPRTNS